jgi:hypothetical protein
MSCHSSHMCTAFIQTVTYWHPLKVGIPISWHNATESAMCLGAVLASPLARAESYVLAPDAFHCRSRRVESLRYKQWNNTLRYKTAAWTLRPGFGFVGYAPQVVCVDVHKESYSHSKILQHCTVRSGSRQGCFRQPGVALRQCAAVGHVGVSHG